MRKTAAILALACALALAYREMVDAEWRARVQAVRSEADAMWFNLPAVSSWRGPCPNPPCPTLTVRPDVPRKSKRGRFALSQGAR